jgi:capsid protein
MDRRGNVVSYHKLKQHPGSNQSGLNMTGEIDEIPADIVVHLFKKNRPSMYRGVSQLAPCIELFNKLRRFTEATIETAENAASILGTVETAFQPNLCAAGPGGPAEIPFGGGNLMTLPDGWKYNAYRPEQPMTGYADFKREILHEVISCLLVPWNVASGDSSDFNFASGQLDHRIFERVIKYKRQRLERKLVDRFFRFWLEFATISGIVPAGLGPFKHRWYWPEKEPIDPSKVANANKTLKEAGLLDERKYWQDRQVSYKDAIKSEYRIKALRVLAKEEAEAEFGVTISEDESQTEPSTPKEQGKPEPAIAD